MLSGESYTVWGIGPNFCGLEGPDTTESRKSGYYKIHIVSMFFSKWCEESQAEIFIYFLNVYESFWVNLSYSYVYICVCMFLVHVAVCVCVCVC